MPSVKRRRKFPGKSARILDVEAGGLSRVGLAEMETGFILIAERSSGGGEHFRQQTRCDDGQGDTKDCHHTANQAAGIPPENLHKPEAFALELSRSGCPWMMLRHRKTKRAHWLALRPECSTQLFYFWNKLFTAFVAEAVTSLIVLEVAAMAFST